MSLVSTPLSLDAKFNFNPASVAISCDVLKHQCHGSQVAAGWWTHLNHIPGQLPQKAERNVGELLCLIHSEISEAMEGDRKNLMDDKLPHRKMVGVELADTLCRIFDLAGALDIDIGACLAEKMVYNMQRLDHTLAHRSGEGGKKY